MTGTVQTPKRRTRKPRRTETQELRALARAWIRELLTKGEWTGRKKG